MHPGPKGDTAPTGFLSKKLFDFLVKQEGREGNLCSKMLRANCKAGVEERERSQALYRSWTLEQTDVDMVAVSF